MNRRQALKALAAVPVSAPVLAHSLTTSAHASMAGLAVRKGSRAISATVDAKRKVYTSFRDWLLGVGLKQLKREAKQVFQIDPDLIEMRLPLATKHRMQQRRNLDRLIDERRDWFSQAIERDGIVEWYQ